MKTKILKLIFVVIAVSLSITAFTQTVTFKYDRAGNRELRNVILLQRMEVDSSINKQTVVYNEMLGETKLTISPNPNGGKFSVKIDGEMTESLNKIYLYNLNGSIIYENLNASILTEIDISDRENGIYILSLIIANEKKTWKIIKQ